MKGLPRVAVVVRPLAEIDEITLVLVSVEFWPESIVLRVAGLPNATTAHLDAEHQERLQTWLATRMAGDQDIPPPTEPGVVHLSRLNPTIHDDVETPYTFAGGSMGGTGTEWRGEWLFRPGPSETATLIKIEFDDVADRSTISVPIPVQAS
jgi:hypothetical protein